jgi:hypothetical protein
MIARRPCRAAGVLVPEVGRAPEGSTRSVRRRDPQHENDASAYDIHPEILNSPV